MRNFGLLLGVLIGVAVFERPSSAQSLDYSLFERTLDALRNDVPVVIDTSGRWIHLEGVGKSMPPHARTFMWLNRAHFSQKYAGIPQVVDTLMDQSLL